MENRNNCVLCLNILEHHASTSSPGLFSAEDMFGFSRPPSPRRRKALGARLTMHNHLRLQSNWHWQEKGREGCKKKVLANREWPFSVRSSTKKSTITFLHSLVYAVSVTWLFSSLRALAAFGHCEPRSIPSPRFSKKAVFGLFLLINTLPYYEINDSIVGLSIRF